MLPLGAPPASPGPLELKVPSPQNMIASSPALSFTVPRKKLSSTLRFTFSVRTCERSSRSPWRYASQRAAAVCASARRNARAASRDAALPGLCARIRSRSQCLCYGAPGVPIVIAVRKSVWLWFVLHLIGVSASRQ